ncbi:MAG: BNR-4 repeat-containing protein [Bacteroidota bacterium]
MKYLLTILLAITLSNVFSQDLRNVRIDGYRGIWFELNQKYPYGDKYSGGLGTYTAKHRPLAIYSKEVNKTFFVFGGTTGETYRYLLCMIGVYDHNTKMVSKPVVVYDKMGVNDPHDNPSLLIDRDGYLWVFVSGRSTQRQGIKLRSTKPYDISHFDIVTEETFTYPQIWLGDENFIHFFTKYTGVRELYFETSPDGFRWTEDKKLAGIPNAKGERAGHYQVSEIYNGGALAGTFFNRHIDGHPDTRTDLYYMQTTDQGDTWTNIKGKKVKTPVSKVNSPIRVIDYYGQGKNVYMKDMSYDDEGNPYCLYLISNGHEPGPDNAPYEWRVTYWKDKEWITRTVTTSDHNYDMGSLYLEGNNWKVVAPTENPPQPWGVGGEIAIWVSTDQGQTWTKSMEVTKNSPLNHSYMRRPLDFKAPFCYFWATGNPHEMSISELYFGDFDGNYWKLPYHMETDFEKPAQMNTPK